MKKGKVKITKDHSSLNRKPHLYDNFEKSCIGDLSSIKIFWIDRDNKPKSPNSRVSKEKERDLRIKDLLNVTLYLKQK